MDIRLIHKDSQALLEQIFPKFDQVNAMVFYFRPDGKVYCMSRTFDGDDEKIETFNRYAQILAFDNAIAYSFISEMWFSTVAEKDFDPAMRPMHRSDRKEGVFIVTSKKTSTKCIGSMYEILRTENSKELIHLDSITRFEDNVKLFERCKITGSVSPADRYIMSQALDEISWRFEVNKAYGAVEV